MKEGEKYVVLERGRDFTLTALADHLNLVYGSKHGSNKPYSAIDIQKYVSRGHLPSYLGGFVLTERKDPGIGIKLITISTEVHASFVKPEIKK